MPEPTTRRNRPTAEVRDQIVGAAAELFAHRAPSDVTLREIAERADVQHSLIIRHFGSKDGLVQAVVGRTATGYAEQVAGASDPADGFVRALHHLLANPVAAAAFASAQIANDEPGDVQRSYPGATLHRSAIEAAAGPDSRDPRIVAAVGVCVVAGWSMLEDWARAAFDLDAVPIDDLREEVADMIRDLITRGADLD